MINEILEVQNILDGTASFNDKNLYRVCYLLAKWYKKQGLDTVTARENIFSWANKQGYFIEYNVNSIVRQAFEDIRPLTDNIKIPISAGDVHEIVRRFDRKNSRLTALALLCYAKAFANSDNTFNVSLAALSEWIQVNRGNLSTRFIPELVAFGYIEKLKNKSSFTWDKVIRAKTLEVKLLVEFSQGDDFQLIGNDIHSLYRDVFENGSLFDEAPNNSAIYGY